MIIHGPVNPAGQATLSVLGLRRLGRSAECVLAPHPLGYAGTDVLLPRQRLRRFACVAPRLLHCDVLHLHGGESLFPGRLWGADARLVRTRGRRVVMEFHGSEARLPSVAARKHAHYVPPEIYDEGAIDQRLASWADLCSGNAIVADHNLDTELIRHFPTVHVVGHRVDTSAFTPTPPSPRARTPVVVHAPSNPRVKGTPAVRSSIDELRRNGVEVEYVEVHGMQHDVARRQFERADLVVDQLCIGAHGVFALEAMSLAKPVICAIRADLLTAYPNDLPIINANPDTLTSVLADWLRRPRDRHELGITSRAYVEREHDVAVVARRLLSAYEQLPKG